MIHLLQKKGARVRYHDPYVRSIEIAGRRMAGSPLSDALVRGQDAVVVTTDHSVFDMRRIVAAARLVVDSRNACRGIRSPKIVRL